MTAGGRLRLLLRVLMETAVVAALALWGAQAGDTTTTRILLAIGAPVVGFGFWGAVDFRWAGRLAEPLRLAQELAVSGVAAGAAYAAGAPVFGIALAMLSVLYHALVYLAGDRLLNQRTAAHLKSAT